MSSLMTFFIGYVVLLIVILFHEYGHFIIHKINNRNPKIDIHSMGLKVTFDLNPYNKFQYDLATFMGVVFGLLPLFFLKGVFNFIEMFIIILVYLSCCTNDLSKLAGLRNDG